MYIYIDYTSRTLYEWLKDPDRRINADFVVTIALLWRLPDWISSLLLDMWRRYDYYYRQYSELYCKLYAIIIQSEYVRHYISLTDGKFISFDEAPFLEISPTHKVTQKLTVGGENGRSFSQEIEDIETPISQFNKRQLCDYIIEHGDLSSQNLLKLAVSYRFAYSNYAGNPEVKNSSTQDSWQCH